MMEDKVVCVIGLGLMGGSLALALRGKCRAVWGVARRRETVEQSLALGAVDFGTTDLQDGLAQADVAILAVPVQAILALISPVGALLPAGALLMDIGSTKVEIMAAMEALPPSIQAIGGHPMCGKETGGLEAAQADLYQGKVFVLTPLGRTSPEALALAQAMVQASGARPLVLEAARHDRLVAAISHLPYLEAVALAQVAAGVAAEDALTWPLAASGFGDTSRLAASNVTVMLDILLTNRANVGALARHAAACLESLATLLEVGNETALRQALQEAQDAILAYRSAK